MTEKERPSSPQPDPIQSSYYQPEDEINILDLLGVLVKKKTLIFVTASLLSGESYLKLTGFCFDFPEANGA